MKVILVFLFVLVLELNAWKYYKGRKGYRKLSDFSTTLECEVCNITSGFFTQKLDHFEPSDTRTWKQQFFTNEEFYDASSRTGPVFLYIEGEGDASEYSLFTGQWVVNAKKFHALCFSLEHRYYGRSQPTNDSRTANLKYLSSEQALADLASFVTAKNKEYNFSPGVKWIVFGGSYSGNLAAWFRLKYPHLAHGAVASSAPVLAEVDFQGYFQVVYESLKLYNEDCVFAISEATSAINQLLETPEGLEQLNQLFNLCEPLTDGSSNNQKNISYLFEMLAIQFALVVQYNYNIPDFPSNVEATCNVMVNKSIGTPIQRLASFYENFCIDYNYDKMIDSLKEPTFDARRMWLYQTCTEFGYYQTSAKSQMFPDQFKVDFFTDQCAAVFGEDFNAGLIDGAVKHTNMIYGQLDIEVSNTVFVHGSIDPWHALGITATRDPQTPVVFINGTTHCRDMDSNLPSDLPQLRDARAFISKSIEAWLSS